jgi:hypothetical protein
MGGRVLVGACEHLTTPAPAGEREDATTIKSTVYSSSMVRSATRTWSNIKRFALTLAPGGSPR